MMRFVWRARREQYIPDDPVLAEQLRADLANGDDSSRCRPGREVSYRPYGRTDEPWRPLGRTPIKDASVPRGLLHWKAELAGFDVAEDVGPGPFWPPRFTFRLVPAGTAPPGMVRIASSDQPFQLFIPGLDHLPQVSLPDYWIDQHEVTNRDFKRFLDDGGYRRAEWWREPFVKDGRPIAFAEAMAFLVDSTGTAGARHLGAGRAIRSDRTTTPWAGSAGTKPRRSRAGPASRCRRSTTGAAPPISG